MPPIKFGKGQLRNPTPASVNLWVRIFTVTAAAFTGWMQTSNLIGPHSQNAISSLLGLGITLANIIGPFFGVETGGAPVPADQVTAMESNDKG